MCIRDSVHIESIPERKTSVLSVQIPCNPGFIPHTQPAAVTQMIHGKRQPAEYGICTDVYKRQGSGGTYYADLRKSHGYEEPFHVKYWCLGNEMYAQWQFGALNADDYAKEAVHFAYAMKRVDPSIKLTAVGLETDPVWNYKTVEKLNVRQAPYAPEAGRCV